MYVYVYALEAMPKSFGDLMDSSPPDFSVHVIFQARILEWVAISFCRVSSSPRGQMHISYVFYIAGRLSTAEPSGKHKK